MTHLTKLTLVALTALFPAFSAHADTHAEVAGSYSNWEDGFTGYSQSHSSKYSYSGRSITVSATDDAGFSYAAKSVFSNGSIRALAETGVAPDFKPNPWYAPSSDAKSSILVTDKIVFTGGHGSGSGSFLGGLSGYLYGGKSGFATVEYFASIADLSGDSGAYESETLISNTYSAGKGISSTLNVAYKSDFDFIFGHEYWLSIRLVAYAQDGGTASFLDSATYSMSLKNGVGLESTSGYSYGVPAVPEPDTYAMLASGLCLIGISARRRRITRG